MKLKIKYLLWISIGILFQNFVIASNDIHSHWAKESINRLSDNHVIQGYEDGNFYPDRLVRVNEFIKMFVRVGGYDIIPKGEMWPDWYIETAQQNGLWGEGDTDRPITRYEVCDMILKYLENVSYTKTNISFKDVPESKQKEIRKIIDLKIIHGYEDQTFRGDNYITRAEAATILCRMKDVKQAYNHSKNISYQKATSQITNKKEDTMKEALFLNTYKINKNKIYFYDKGRYSHLQEYSPSEKMIKQQKLISVIESLLTEEEYVYVSYVPDPYIINQIIITYGKTGKGIQQNSFAFEYIFYEEKPWELRRISQREELSEKCFMKINIAALWKESHELKEKQYIHPYYEEKLYRSLTKLFPNQTAKEMTKYMTEKVIESQERDVTTEMIDCKKIGSYEVNLYIKSGILLEFYISK